MKEVHWNKYVTSWIVYTSDKNNRVHVITTASTFIHSYEESAWLIFEYAKRSTLFLARDEIDEYWIRAAIQCYKVHPEYIKHPGLYGGFDIAVGSFDITDSKSFITNLQTFKNMLSKIVPSIPKVSKLKTKEEVFLTGYPGESGGCMFQIKTNIYDFITVEQKTEMIILKDIKTSGGLSGSPVLKIDENKTEIIGLYVGYDPAWSVEIWTIINSWVLDVINQRLIIKDLKKKLAFIKSKTKENEVTLNSSFEQGEVNHDEHEEKQAKFGEVDKQLIVFDTLILP